MKDILEFIESYPTEAGEELAQHLDDDLMRLLFTDGEAFLRAAREAVRSHVALDSFIRRGQDEV